MSWQNFPDIPTSIDDPLSGKRRRESEGTFRVLDAIAFFAICFPSYLLPGVLLPLGELFAVLITGVAFTRRPTRFGRPWWFPVAALFLPTWLTLSAYLNGDFNVRRLSHVLLVSMLALVVSSGRIDARSMGLGLAAGLPVSSLVSFLGGGGSYEGRLDGWIGDPNAAAFYLTCLGAVALSQTRGGTPRALLGAALAVATIGTFSRTGIVVMAVFGAWLFLGRRASLPLGLAALGTLGYLSQKTAQSLLTGGAFSDRVGSDQLRQRLILAENGLLSHAPFYGLGPGQAQVELQGRSFFFHSSYLGVRAEGGVLVLVAIVSLVALCFLLLGGGHGGDNWRRGWAQCALLSPLVMSLTLGEVLLDLPTAIGVGYAMNLYLRPEAPMVPSRNTGGKPGVVE